MQEHIKNTFAQAIELKQQVLSDQTCIDKINNFAEACVEAYRKDKAVYFCGNGGSAADAQHLAAELSGRFYYDRPPLNSEALHVNTSYLTAVANDYSYDEIYARMVNAKLKEGDVLVGISTSGNSKNIIRAFEEAEKKKALCVAMTGETGGKMKDLADILLNIPSTDTPRIQEIHILIGHLVCEIVERKIFPKL